METVFLLSYGCNLDHGNIDKLVEELIIPYKKFRPNKVNKNIPKDPEIKLIYDVFDVNCDKHVENKYFLEEFYISKDQLQSFEQSLFNLKGQHIRCRSNIRGHYSVLIEGKEYSARVFVTLDNNNLIFLDDESINNSELRKELTHLPEHLHWLIIPREYNYNEIESFVEKWIQNIYEKVRK